MNLRTTCIEIFLGSDCILPNDIKVTTFNETRGKNYMPLT